MVDNRDFRATIVERSNKIQRERLHKASSKDFSAEADLLAIGSKCLPACLPPKSAICKRAKPSCWFQQKALRQERSRPSPCSEELSRFSRQRPRDNKR